MCQAIQIRCANPECKQPFTATRRYDEESTTLFYACNECMALRHGPHELQHRCRKCGQDNGWSDCACNIEFMYGGPLVVCDQCLKQTVWIDSQSGTGFAGGQIYLDTYYCGHNVMDESDDMRAAY